MVQKITARTADQITKVIIEAIHNNPGMFKTFTFYKGTEFHGYKAIEKETGGVCFFAARFHSWERGKMRTAMGSFDNTYKNQSVCQQFRREIEIGK